MKALHSAYKRPLMVGSCALVLALIPLHAALAQDSAFLACEQFSDRGQRIACLEDALEAATAAEQEQPAAAPPVPAASPAVTTTPAPPTPTITTRQAPAAVAQEAEEDGPSLLERLRNFGKETMTFSDDEEGQEQLNDTITALDKQGSYWIVTLSSGQVWEQDYPRALNLRVGDAITIYQAGLGDGYRMSTERLSGFIRVKRVR
jgi:hypothetical protein